MRNILTREDVIKELKKIIGKDLRVMAKKYGATVFKNGKPNKGWAGHVLEKYLGIGLSSIQAPNGKSWELKVVPLKKNKEGNWTTKETMAITMINAENVKNTPFEKSHLFNKLKGLIICGREFVSKNEPRAKLLSVGSFDMVDKKIYQQVKEDYELVRNVLKENGFNALTGKMGVLVQPRTKGPGHGSTSRAFYARTKFVKIILGLK